MTSQRFSALWRSLAPIGNSPHGYHRSSWTYPDLACREWFAEEAADRGLAVETDGNGNLWAWLGDPTAGDAVVTGSHLDSVPGGGGYDGPLGIVSAFLALDLLLERGVEVRRPVGVVAFTEEEGSRFGMACLGSRLLTGALDPERAAALRDRDGVTLVEAMKSGGVEPSLLGPDPVRLKRIGAFVELHIEQGRALAVPVGVASAIWPHGRWRLDFAGTGNHAGTTRMDERHDPMLTFAYTVLAANKEARLRGGHATVGRVGVEPNATNAIPTTVTAWLDARAAEQSTLDGLVDAIGTRATERAARDGTSVTLTPESVSPVTEFHDGLRDRIATLLGGVPVLPTGAGHDAGALAAHVPTAMLFVRNPTGVSHAPEEYATDEDCAAGVEALAAVLEELACR
ncbi:MAG: allantoate amidohydrolase [Actinobacteria bacterium 13_2_20CM_2_71_6]|nr:MAG: allantoate amidohydrolase [Actinobacteria bacterium 13_2_20CM_2_71_6]